MSWDGKTLALGGTYSGGPRSFSEPYSLEVVSTLESRGAFEITQNSGEAITRLFLKVPAGIIPIVEKSLTAKLKAVVNVEGIKPNGAIFVIRGASAREVINTLWRDEKTSGLLLDSKE